MEKKSTMPSEPLNEVRSSSSTTNSTDHGQSDDNALLRQAHSMNSSSNDDRAYLRGTHAVGSSDYRLDDSCSSAPLLTASAATSQPVVNPPADLLSAFTEPTTSQVNYEYMRYCIHYEFMPGFTPEDELDRMESDLEFEEAQQRRRLNQN